MSGQPIGIFIGGLILDAVTLDGTDTVQYSTPFTLGKCRNFSLQARVVATAGSLNGTAKVFVTNKPDADLTTDTDWDEVASPALTDPAGTDLAEFIAFPDEDGAIYRVKYTRASGTGSATVYLKKTDEY
jgi:hypothetical protein